MTDQERLMRDYIADEIERNARGMAECIVKNGLSIERAERALELLIEDCVITGAHEARRAMREAAA